MLSKHLIALGVIGSMALTSFVPSAYARNDQRFENWNKMTAKYAKRNNLASRSDRMGYSRDYDGERDPYSYDASFPRKISRGNFIKVDLGKLAWGAYDDEGNLIRTGRVSGGKSYCPDIGRKCRTVTGTYTIYSKRGAGCKSTRFPVGRGGAPMPYCMFFHGGYALHGSYQVPNYNASHGCVRMIPEDAQWLNQNFVRVGSTRVSITY